MMHATTHEIAYIAGFFDGEGSISIEIDRGRYLLSVSVGQVDPAPLQFLADRFGGKVKLTNHWEKRNNARPFHMWRIKCAQAESFIQVILPHLIVKKQEAHVALRFRSTFNGKCGPLGNETRAVRNECLDALLSVRRLPRVLAAQTPLRQEG